MLWSEFEQRTVALPALEALPIEFRPRLTPPPELPDLDFLAGAAYRELLGAVSRVQGGQVLGQWLGQPTDTVQMPCYQGPGERLLLQLSDNHGSGMQFGDAGDVLFSASVAAVAGGRWTAVIGTGYRA
jgi:hypothetical protein